MKSEYKIIAAARDNIIYLLMMIVFAISVWLSEIPHKNVVLVGMLFLSTSMSLNKSVIRTKD